MSRQWHLDVDYPDRSFETLWPSESHRLLLALFKHVDTQADPVLSVLPPGISPAGAAIAASLYFLPGIPAPPRPHSRIALYPGRNFVSFVKSIEFGVTDLYRVIQKARGAQRGHLDPNPPLVKLEQAYGKKSQERVNFHWIWRCDRIWKLYDEVERQELKPRGNFGRRDRYEATIEIIDSEELIDRPQDDPFDLLVYCPYYHSWDSGDQQHPAQRVLAALKSFHADRKLIVVRSPYEYWARKLSDELNTDGIAFVTKSGIQTGPDKGKLNFEIVNQCLTGPESKLLCDEMAKLSLDATSETQKVIGDFRGKLKRLLVALAPISPEELPNQIAFDLNSMAESLGLTKSPQIKSVIETICRWVECQGDETKLKRLGELVDENTVVWVTKESDRRAALDALAKLGKKNKVLVVDRWMKALQEGGGKKRILTRIDRESDLDWISYLLPDDTVLMTSWEAMVRAPMIVKTWERSDRWRDNAKRIGISSATTYQEEHDPILQFADFILNFKNKCCPGNGATVDTKTKSEWWDDADRKDTFSPVFKRDELISNDEGKPCREIHFGDGTGIFLKSTAEMQIIRDDAKEREVSMTGVEDLKAGDILILPKDAERGTVFDLLMENLERSEAYGSDAKTVRLWKDNLSEGFQRFGGTFAELLVSLKEKGGSADLVTVRTWVYGSTMAPLREENTHALMVVLGITQPALSELTASVGKLRNISRALGRFLSNLALRAKQSTAIARELQSTLDDSGIDIEEILGAIELKTVKWISPDQIPVATHQIRKVFKCHDEANSVA